MAGGFGLFSGVELNVDPARGLNGFCGFLLTRSPMQSVLTAPVVAVVGAKNDNLRTGLGQCIAATVAAGEFNTRSGLAISPMHGAVTTGTAWMFLRLAGSVVTLDHRECLIADPGRIMGAFARIVGST